MEMAAEEASGSIGGPRKPLTEEVVERTVLTPEASLTPR